MGLDLGLDPAATEETLALPGEPPLHCWEKRGPARAHDQPDPRAPWPDPPMPATVAPSESRGGEGSTCGTMSLEGGRRRELGV